MILVFIESKVSLLSFIVLMAKNLNISHSGVFGGELRRIKARTLSSIEYFILEKWNLIV